MRNFQDSFEASKPSFTSAISICVSKDKKCSFFGKLGMLCFLETSVLRFALLPYYRQNEMHFSESYSELCETPKIENFFIFGRVLNTLLLSARKGKLESFILKLPRFLVVINIVTLAFIFHSSDKLRSHSISKKITFIVHYC